MIRPDVPCSDVVERIVAYLDGALSEAEAVEVELHLVLCHDCCLYLDQMRATIALTGRIPDEPVPPVLEDALVSAFRAIRGDR